MDDRQASLKEKLSRLLLEVAEVEVELSRAEGAIVGVPHYSVIESRAHELGKELSRKVQQRHMGEITATAARRARCPCCSAVCEVQEQKRPLTSIDGQVQVQELKGHCPFCRRDFFPPAGSDGA
jgi:hypothetical protein